jgi:hypothetical protein
MIAHLLATIAFSPAKFPDVAGFKTKRLSDI